MGNELANQWTIADIEKAAEYVAKSRLFPAKRPEEAVVLMLQAQADGTHPMRAMAEYHIIQGRPALRADAMLARFQSAGGKVEWKELSEDRVVATFSHPQGGSATIEWTIDMAKKAGLVKPGSGWTKFPRAMLRSRVVSEGVRTVFPGIATGMYTPEEVMDFDDEPQKIEAEVVSPPEKAEKAPPKKAAPSSTKKKPKGAQGASQAATGALKEMAERLKAIFLDSPELMLAFSRIAVGREIESARDLTKAEVAKITNLARAIADGLAAAGIEGELAKAVVIAYLEKGEIPPTEGPYGEAEVVDAVFEEVEEESI